MKIKIFNSELKYSLQDKRFNVDKWIDENDGCNYL